MMQSYILFNSASQIAQESHPFETLWVKSLRVSLVVLLVIPIPVFIAFLLVLNVLSVFNHANLRLPEVLDRCLRLQMITPNMHETHHSVRLANTDFTAE